MYAMYVTHRPTEYKLFQKRPTSQSVRLFLSNLVHSINSTEVYFKKHGSRKAKRDTCEQRWTNRQI